MPRGTVTTGLTSYGLALVVLRLIGLVLVARWLLSWLVRVIFIVGQAISGNTHANIFSVDSLPPPLSSPRFWESYESLGQMLTLAAGVYLLVGGRSLSRFVSRGADLPTNRCQGCGYLLRGLNTSTCPECGEPTRSVPTQPPSEPAPPVQA